MEAAGTGGAGAVNATCSGTEIAVLERDLACDGNSVGRVTKVPLLKLREIQR